MYKVPIISPDLRHEETIIQAAYALDCLQNTISTMFERIDQRIERNNAKVLELRERISKSQAKINSLHGTRKAIRIYAPSRFPASAVFKDLPVTFNDENNLAVQPKNKYQVESKMDTNIPSVNEKLIFFHVRDQSNIKSSSESALSRERYNIKPNQNLGNIPPDLRSMASMLLFNTDYSVYNSDEIDSETVVHSDAWKRAKLLKNKRQQQSIYQTNLSKQILDPAPHSLVHRRNEKLTPSGGLRYTPKLSEAPEIDVPLDLPDLPGIADDLRYESQEPNQKIAPSLALVVQNLPELTELLVDNKKEHDLTESADNSINIPPPPPPPPPAMRSKVPPPQPPFAATGNGGAQIKANIVKTTETISSSSGDMRSELMAAIRNAGGVGKARLRPTAASPLAANDNDVVDNKCPNNPTDKTMSPIIPQGDLMADLHNKLLMRRKGISGSKDKNNSNIKNVSNVVSPKTYSDNSVISRLSSLIPPPNVTNRTEHSAATTSDEGDSNDNDWVD